MRQDKFYTDTVGDKFSGDDAEVFSGIDVKERTVYSPRRYLCSNCNDSRHDAFFGDTVCRGRGCKCPCQTHYQGRDGRLRPYGTKDDSKDEVSKQNKKLDVFIHELNKEWRKLNTETPVKKEDFYS